MSLKPPDYDDLPVGTASGERRFSQLTRIKTLLGSAMVKTTDWKVLPRFQLNTKSVEN